MSAMTDTTEHVDTLIIGGGQAGLAAGYHLARRGMPFLILDADERIGDHWRERWDSLRLFTPARFDGLDVGHEAVPSPTMVAADATGVHKFAPRRRRRLRCDNRR